MSIGFPKCLAINKALPLIALASASNTAELLNRSRGFSCKIQYHVTEPVNLGFNDEPAQIDPIRCPWSPVLIAPAELHSMSSASQKALPSFHNPILPYLYKGELSGIP